jgi:hypothetical protein
MDNKIFTSPLFLSTVFTLIVVLIIYFYNSHQEKKEDKESKGGIYYFGLLVLVFCICYGALYLYNNLTSSGPTEVAKKVMEGGKKLMDEIKPEVVANPATPLRDVLEPVVTKLPEQIEVLKGALSPNAVLEGAEDFIRTGLPDW